MTDLTHNTEISFDIDLAPGHGCLEMSISNGSSRQSFGLSLKEARALSLELVRQASLAERRLSQDANARQTLEIVPRVEYA
ncbi:MAG: hypothetical protein H6935_05660 [Thiobacillus sp.]|nr:hypothetical protein [Thiobacillus sp.]